MRKKRFTALILALCIFFNLCIYSSADSIDYVSYDPAVEIGSEEDTGSDTDGLSGQENDPVNAGTDNAADNTETGEDDIGSSEVTDGQDDDQDTSADESSSDTTPSDDNASENTSDPSDQADPDASSLPEDTAAPTIRPYTPDPDAVVTPYVAPTSVPGEYDDTERFIIRLYSYCLGRAQDERGLLEWHDALISGSSNGADCGYGFVFSNEYLGRHTTDSEFVSMLYRVFLDREPDQNGISSWVRNLQSGMSREHIFSGFVMSPEYSQICANYGIDHGYYSSDQPRDENINVTAFVQRLYNLSLGRPGDVDGLNFWCAKLNNNEIFYEECAEAFVNSPEFLSKNLSDEAYITVLYRVFLDRDPDDQGLEAWIEQLENGVDRNEMLRNFAYSTEFGNIINSVGSEPREIITHESGSLSWTQIMTSNGLLPDARRFQRDLIERANDMLEAQTAYGFGRTVPENGTIDCSAFVTNLFRRTLGTMDVIDHYAGGGVCESDNCGPYYHYFGDGMQDLTDRGTWTSNTFTEGRYTAPGCGYLYVDRYGITSTDLMDCYQWNHYLEHFNVAHTTVSFTENRRMKPIVYGANGEILTWGEWEFMQDFRPGDIVLWTDAEHHFSVGSGSNHIGIYMGNGMVCHSTSADYDLPGLPTTYRGMQLTNISRIRNYYQHDGNGSIIIYHIF